MKHDGPLVLYTKNHSYPILILFKLDASYVTCNHYAEDVFGLLYVRFLIEFLPNLDNYYVVLYQHPLNELSHLGILGLLLYNQYFGLLQNLRKDSFVSYA